MMALGGAMLAAGVLAAPVALRALGAARVVLRYAERLVTHGATFRALADLRVWFFRDLAAAAAGGLGFRQAGDVLARLVSDIEALDGLYLRILVPLAGAVLLLPALLVLIGLHSPLLALRGRRAVRHRRVPAALAGSAHCGRRGRGAGRRDRRAAHRRARRADRAARGARVRRRGPHAGRGAGARGGAAVAQHDLAGRAALANAGALLCAQAAILAVLLAAGSTGRRGGRARSWWSRRSRRSAACRAPACWPGHAAAAAHRVLEAAEAPVPVPDPPASRCRCRPASRCASRRCTSAGSPDRPPVFDGLTLEVPQGARVALLGPSGAGKSTLAALALKVAAPQQGRVLLGGVDIAIAGRGRRARADRLAGPGDASVRRHDPRESAARPAGRR